ncbi:MAG: class I SAM-dependent methyltransferase [Deltaproteobacteria bacterium]|nr:class I SAM-dependent methyltransferase [Deltaproteobacteria bacterium]
MTADINSLYRAPELYDAEFGAYRADVAFYENVLRRHPGRVVELGCGTGRLHLLLSPPDYVGVDRERAMLARFQRRWLRPPPPLVNAELAALPLAGGSARVVILAYNLLQHLMDPPALTRALREAGRVAGPDGVVALDTFMPPWPGSERHDDDFCFSEQRRHPDGSIMEVAEQTSMDAGGVQVTRLRFAPRGGGEAVVHDVVRRLWGADELLGALTAAGLARLWLWGDVDGSAFDARSPRFMACCAPVA